MITPEGPLPVSVRRKSSGKYQVRNAGRVTAKGTNKTTAKRQANLLRGLEHGWKPTR